MLFDLKRGAPVNYQTIILEKKEHIAVMTLNRPERLNAINPQMRKELLSVFDDVDKDDEMRVLVLTGAGRGFCSGGDVGGMIGGIERGTGTTGETKEIQQGLSPSVGGVILKLQKVQKPTIAMVNGAAVGAGFDLALACDLRVGSENASFVNGFIRIGLSPVEGGTWLYPRVMGLGKALEYLFTGDFMEAKEAERLGVLNRLVPADELENETMSLARKIANGPPIAMRLTKLQVYEGLGMDLETALQMVAARQSIASNSEDHKEGVTAFREKRRAVFKGR